MDPFRQVQPGQPLAISATAWNALMQSLRADMRKELGTLSAAGNGQTLAIPQKVILVYNATGASLQEWDLVELTGSEVTVASKPWEAMRRPVISGRVLVSADPPPWIAITMEPIAAGKLGRAVISGVTTARLDVPSDGDPLTWFFAKPIVGSKRIELAEEYHQITVISHAVSADETGLALVYLAGLNNAEQILGGPKFEVQFVTKVCPVITRADITVPDTFPPSGTAGGDLYGTYPNPGVDGWFGVPLANNMATVTSGQIPVFNGTQWAPVSPSGDLTGGYDAPQVDGFLGRALSTTAPTEGQAYLWDATSSRWTPATVGGMPVGAIVAYISTTLPTDYGTEWKACDGSAISRSTYSTLFSRIGTAYGSGDGGTTFTLPDFRGRVIVGQGTGSGLSTRSLGGTFGAELHALTTAQLSPHAHGYRLNTAVTGFLANSGPIASYPFQAAASSNTDSAGSGSSHENMQPSGVACWIIRVK